MRHTNAVSHYTYYGNIVERSESESRSQTVTKGALTVVLIMHYSRSQVDGRANDIYCTLTTAKSESPNPDMMK